jgi:hypothetical protein
MMAELHIVTGSEAFQYTRAAGAREKLCSESICHILRTVLSQDTRRRTQAPSRGSHPGVHRNTDYIESLTSEVSGPMRETGRTFELLLSKGE